MAKKLEDIEREARELSVNDRAILVERLLETLDTGEDEDVEEMWLKEAERRYDEYKRGKLKAIPAEEVFEMRDGNAVKCGTDLESLDDHLFHF